MKIKVKMAEADSRVIDEDMIIAEGDEGLLIKIRLLFFTRKWLRNRGISSHP